MRATRRSTAHAREVRGDMRQAYLVSPKTIEVREIAPPALRAGDVRVKIRAALTCGTDLKTYRRGHPKLGFGPFGHEAAGDVIEVGPGVTKFKPGDAIMWVQTAPCGACPACERHRENLCEHLFEDIALGAYADEIVLPKKIVERNAFAKPDSLGYIEAAFLEPVACVVHGWNVVKRANAARPLPDEVAILGAGTIGLLHLLYARHAGIAAAVVARRPNRQALAARLGGAPLSANSSAAFDLVIESAGTAEAWQQAIALAKPGGRALLFGGLPGGARVPVDATRVHYDELTLLGSFHFTPADVVEARELLCTAKWDVRVLLTGVEPLDAVASVFERLDRREGFKFALVPENSMPQRV